MEYVRNFEEFLSEGRDVKEVHHETRRVKQQTIKEYPFYLIKDYMDKGYWDKVKKNDFKKAYDVVMAYLLRVDSNTARIAKQYDWMTDFDELWQYQLDKED